MFLLTFQGGTVQLATRGSCDFVPEALVAPTKRHSWRVREATQMRRRHKLALAETHVLRAKGALTYGPLGVEIDGDRAPQPRIDLRLQPRLRLQGVRQEVRRQRRQREILLPPRYVGPRRLVVRETSVPLLGGVQSPRSAIVLVLFPGEHGGRCAVDRVGVRQSTVRQRQEIALPRFGPVLAALRHGP